MQLPLLEGYAELATDGGEHVDNACRERPRATTSESQDPEDISVRINRHENGPPSPLMFQEAEPISRENILHNSRLLIRYDLGHRPSLPRLFALGVGLGVFRIAQATHSQRFNL